MTLPIYQGFAALRLLALRLQTTALQNEERLKWAIACKEYLR
ncbi:hypothetical protein [Altericista sp. CCNU0014]